MAISEKCCRRRGENDLKAKYFNIQRFCLRDGPGIRTTLFLKGCPLRCAWCHNPEGQGAMTELLFRSDKCVACGMCLGLCGARRIEEGSLSFDRKLCTSCGKCVEKCNFDCNELCGADDECDEIFGKLVRDRLYFENSGGGITVSGGEPLFQSKAVIRLAEKAFAENIGFAVETSGYAKSEDLLKLASLSCLFLYDIKGIDDDKHIANTGVSNRIILENLDALEEAGANVILRLPMIPGFNDSPSDLELLSDFLRGKKDFIRRAEIMPYHRIGLGKAAAAGRTDARCAGVPDGRQFVEKWIDSLSRSGVKVIAG